MLQSNSVLESYTQSKNLYNEGKYAESLKIALKTLDLAKKEKDTKYIILANHLISKILYTNKNLENSLKYYKETLSLIKKYKNNILREANDSVIYDYNLIKSEAILGIGNSFYNLSNKKNLEIYKDSALTYYQKIDSVKQLNNQILNVQSNVFNNLSVIYMNDSIYDKAKIYAKKAIRAHRNLNDKVSEATSLGNLSSIYVLENNYEEAKKIYFQALDLIRNINSAKSLKVREDLYYNLAYNLYKLKDYKAYDYQELSYLIKDSLRDNEFRAMIAEITEKYNFDSKKKLLLKEQENKRLKDQRTFWIFGIGSFVIILSLLFWLNFYKLKQKNLGLKLSQSELIQHQKIEKLKSESQIRILNATIDGKETERKQIAETLHDSVSALLSSANLHLQATRKQFNGKTPLEIDKTQQIITEASDKIRDLSHTLVSSVLLKFGLKFAIKDMAEKYSNSQISITTEIGNVRRYHQNFEIKVYNIIQEFVNNILKHSKATEALL